LIAVGAILLPLSENSQARWVYNHRHPYWHHRCWHPGYWYAGCWYRGYWSYYGGPTIIIAN